MRSQLALSIRRLATLVVPLLPLLSLLVVVVAGKRW